MNDNHAFFFGLEVAFVYFFGLGLDFSFDLGFSEDYSSEFSSSSYSSSSSDKMLLCFSPSDLLFAKVSKLGLFLTHGMVVLIFWLLLYSSSNTFLASNPFISFSTNSTRAAIQVAM